MYWGPLQSVRYHVKSSLWTVPLLAIPVAMLATTLLHWLDAQRDWTLLGFGVTGATALLQAAATATLSFMVFTFGSLLVAIQVASGQLTPRIIATTLLRDNVVRYTVGLFMLTFLFALGVHNRIDGKVHQLPLFVAAILSLASFASFLYLIDYASRLLRPIAILTRVGNEGLAVIASVYPEPSLGPGLLKSQRQTLAAPDRVITHHGTSGIVLAVNLEELKRTAESSRGVIELVPQVGDFVAVDEPLFNLYGGAFAVEEDTLRSAVAFGSERTMEQDPTFAFRIVIDIALKALSPAINDPTTGQPFAGNRIPAERFSSASKFFFPYILLPNSGPIIVVTVVPDSRLVAGFTVHDVLHKPLDRERFLERLHELAPATPASRAPTVLVIDDDPQVHDFLGLQLDEAGYRVLGATSGQEGVLLAAAHRPAVIVLDLIMDGMDGFQAAAELQRLDETSAIPILVFTTKELSEDERRRLAGAAGVLSKAPEDRRRIVAAVREIVGRSAGKEAGGAPHLGR